MWTDRNRHAWRVRISVATIGVLVALLLARFPRRGSPAQIVLNGSPSAPQGLWQRSDAVPSVGRWIEIRLSGPGRTRLGEWAGGVGAGTLLKPIVAGPGDKVDTSGNQLKVNGNVVGLVVGVGLDRHPPIVRLRRRLAADEFFVYSDRVPNALDSRHFGPICTMDVVCVRVPWLLWDAPAAEPTTATAP